MEEGGRGKGEGGVVWTLWYVGAGACGRTVRPGFLVCWGREKIPPPPPPPPPSPCGYPILVFVLNDAVCGVPLVWKISS